MAALKVLVIDDHQPMRQIIRESLYRLGMRNVVMVGTAPEALRAMKSETIDLILSDYNLGPGVDGQQLLEAARSANLVSPVAPWIFITANSIKADVMAAGDYTPDGYILKPFTDQLLAKYIDAVSARKTALAPLLVAISERRWEDVLDVAEGYVSRGDALRVEGIKQQAHALMKLGRFDEAGEAYDAALQLNSELAWASHGRAQALRALNDTEAARSLLEELIKTQPDYAAAYDALLEIAEEQGDQDAALAIAQAVADRVPNAKRKIKLGTVALGAGQAEIAVKALEHAVSKNRNSPTKSYYEGVLLAQALLDSGDPKRSLAVAADVNRQWPDHATAQMMCNAVRIQGLQQTGATKEAAALMTDIEASLADAVLDNHDKLLLAKAALATGRMAVGQGLIESIARDNTDKPLMVAAAMRAAAGTPVEEAFKAAVERAGADIQDALQALRQAKRDGDLTKAIAIGEGALELSPANFNVLIELCTLYLLPMNRLGKAQEHTERARMMLDSLEERYPHHGRVAAARKFYRERLAAA